MEITGDITLKIKTSSMDDAVMTAFSSHQRGLGLIPAQCHMWVEFALQVFVQVLRFSSLHKNQHVQISIWPG